MRLMMGFETPKSGAVYYDGKDIQKLDQKSLRQQIGVVMQTENSLVVIFFLILRFQHRSLD